MSNYDPNDVGLANGNLFGLPFSYEESEVVILPVPWEVTVSYNAGTAQGPAAILEASPQLDLYDFYRPNAWQRGIHLLPINQNWQSESDLLRLDASKYIAFLENGGEVAQNKMMQQVVQKINNACQQLKEEVKAVSKKHLLEGKKVGLLGGDHSVPLGFLEALSEQHSEFGILQIDAHADLRKAYEGFSYSHASIFYNALNIPQITKLVSVGVRDICQAEINFIQQHPKRIHAFFDKDIKEQVHIYRHQTWATYCQQIIAPLPEKVYISFDIDGLDPKLCPYTGTPVLGGLEAHEAIFLIQQVAASGRQIIGFDLCEVAPNATNPNDEWDANVGARILYQLCNLL